MPGRSERVLVWGVWEGKGRETDHPRPHSVTHSPCFSCAKINDLKMRSTKKVDWNTMAGAMMTTGSTKSFLVPKIILAGIRNALSM